MYQNQHRGLALVELLVIVAIGFVLASVLLPQLRIAPADDRLTQAEYHLATLRAAVETYRQEHQGRLPTHDDRASFWAALTLKTQRSGAIDPLGPCGEYLQQVLENPFNGSPQVGVTSSDQLTAEDVAAQDECGWLYNPETGRLFLASDPGFDL